jgi:hypothetical protein
MVFLLLKHLGLITDLWWLEEARNPVLMVSPRLLAVILFNFSGMANLQLEEPEKFGGFLTKKGTDYAFSFIKRKFISDNEYLELEPVNT